MRSKETRDRTDSGTRTRTKSVRSSAASRALSVDRETSSFDSFSTPTSSFTTRRTGFGGLTSIGSRDMNPQLETVQQRIEALKQKAIRIQQRQAAAATTEAPEFKEQAPTMEERPRHLQLVATYVPPTSKPVEIAKEPLMEKSMEFDLGNDAEEMATIRDVVVEHTRSFTLFLTPIEEAVWVELYLRATNIDGQERVGLPEEGFVTDPSWKPTGIECSPEEYVEAMRRFTTCGILEYMGEGRPGIGKAPFRFVVNPNRFTIVKIERRAAIKTQQMYLDIMRCVQLGQFTPSTTKVQKELESWLSARFQEINPETTRWKLLGFRGIEYIEQRPGGWGIITTDKDGRPSYCWAGFEPVTFELIPGAPVRQYRERSSKASAPWNIRPGQPPTSNTGTTSTVKPEATEPLKADEQTVQQGRPCEPVVPEVTTEIVNEPAASDVSTDTKPTLATQESIEAEPTQAKPSDTNVQPIAETRIDEAIESLSSSELDTQEDLLRRKIADAQEAIRLAEAKIELIGLERQRRAEEARRRKAEEARLEAERAAIEAQEREAAELLAKLQMRRNEIEANLAALRN